MRLYRILALMLKYWYITINSADRMFDVFYWPVLGLIIFGFTTMYIEKIANVPSIFVFLMGGTMLWSLFTRIQQDIGVYILEDFWSRNIANSFATPITSGEVFVSVTLFGIIRSIVSFIVMIILAIVAYQFNIFAGGLMSLWFILPLFLFAWGIGLLTSGLIFRFGTRVQIFTWSLSYLLEPFAAVYYPLETLPSIMQSVAYVFPPVYVFEGFRLAYDGFFSWYHFLWALALSSIYFVLCYISFVRSIKRARETGFLTKY